MTSEPHSGKRILVVEDDPDTRAALALVLTAAGYEVHVAADGQEALQGLRSGPPPDLILLDLVMPVLDGWQFRRLQQQDPALASIPVLVVTASTDLEQNATALGVAGLLQKPIEFEQLLQTVRTFATAQKPGVLVVDDEPQLRTLLEVALRHHGFDVYLAANGQAAVEMYRRHHEAIALVLLDVQMPVLDGPWTLVALQKINPDVRCCFMSGHLGSYTAEMLLAVGAWGVFQKPFGIADLSRNLRRLLAGDKGP